MVTLARQCCHMPSSGHFKQLCNACLLSTAQARSPDSPTSRRRKTMACRQLTLPTSFSPNMSYLQVPGQERAAAARQGHGVHTVHAATVHSSESAITPPSSLRLFTLQDRKQKCFDSFLVTILHNNILYTIAGLKEYTFFPYYQRWASHFSLWRYCFRTFRYN